MVVRSHSLQPKRFCTGINGIDKDLRNAVGSWSVGVMQLFDSWELLHFHINEIPFVNTRNASYYYGNLNGLNDQEGFDYTVVFFLLCFLSYFQSVTNYEFSFSSEDTVWNMTSASDKKFFWEEKILLEEKN
jgi:hypothetical protein